MQSNDYWSGTEHAPNPDNAWNFNGPRRADPSGPTPLGGRLPRSGGQGAQVLDGNQNNDDKNNALYAVAVRPGG